VASLTGKAIAVAVPIVISIVALVVSYRAYDDQHAADQAATTSSEQQYARMVSVWQWGETMNKAGYISVQNLSPAAVSEVMIFTNDSKSQAGLSIPLGDIPPCEIATSNLRPVMKAEGVHQPWWDVVNGSGVEFIDGNGVAWTRNPDGNLSRGYNVVPPGGAAPGAAPFAPKLSPSRG
jgi:hypothetical protein